jgi:Ca2+-binding RTX toxin-like protein
VFLSGGDDVIDNRGGTILGRVFGGSGDDTYYVDGDGSDMLNEGSFGGTDEVVTTTTFALGDHFENLTLAGSADATGVGNAEANTLTGNAGGNRLGASLGDDTVIGGQGNDTLYGGGGNDSLLGGEDDDLISAGAGSDTILGEEGDDVLLGRRGSDLINGGEGADLIDGGDSADNLLGGRDNDTLIGGAGSDKLNGGSGADVFIWNFASESLDGSSRDTINSYEAGLDVLDFSAITGGMAFDLNIGAAHSGGGVASLRTFETGGGDTRVFLDLDGDGSSEMRVDVLGVIGLTVADFIL